MKLISLRKPKADKVEQPMPTTEEYYEEYPWGTRITLTSDDIGSFMGKFPLLATAEAGKEMELMAKVRVKSAETSESDEKNGKKKHKRVELQITDMAFSSEEGLDEEFEMAADG